MKKHLLFSTAITVAAGAFAQGWTEPEYKGEFQTLTPGDTVYLYNTEAKMFLGEGNDWGTHASVSSVPSPIVVNQYVEEEMPWDGVTYTISDYSAAKGAWKNMFITDGGHVYMDLGNQADYFFSFVDNGDKTYTIIGADKNPVWSASGEMEGYMLGRYTDYMNTRDNVQTGTGVIYDYYGLDHNYLEGQFQTKWAFVSSSDCAEYLTQVETYLLAQELKSAIDEAKEMGVDVADEEAVYNNTSSAKEQIIEASENVTKKVLAYYETSVTPTSPKDLTDLIANPTGDAIDGWNNDIAATTWNTQNWIGDGWTGFSGNTLNIWGASLQGTVNQSLSGLPNGIYVVSMAVFSEKETGAVFANENTKEVSGGAIGAVYEVTTEVTDGNLTFGFSQSVAATNWIAIDNASVKYYGSGVEAYRYWLNGLLESAPNFDDVVVCSSLLKEYEDVLESVNVVETKEEILGIIPAYEEILNRISLNVQSYTTLKDNVTKAEEMNNDGQLNAYYSEKIGNYCTDELEAVIEEHALGTDDVNAHNKALEDMMAEAQDYIWQMEKLAGEVAVADSIYNECQGVCSLESAEAYEQFKSAYDELDPSELTVADVKKMLDDLYAIEFSLQIPTEPASDDNPISYTSKIFNPTFIGVDGWTNDGWATFSNNDWYGFANEEGASDGSGNYLNLWNTANATASQTLTKLPAGAYEFTIGAFADKDGFEIFANEETLTIPAGQDGSTYMRNYTIPVIVGEDGILTIGARNTNGGEIWAMVDEARLTYYGTESAIVTEIAALNPSDNTAIQTVYSVAGTRVQTLRKGINIVRMSDNSIRKILVK